MDEFRIDKKLLIYFFNLLMKIIILTCIQYSIVTEVKAEEHIDRVNPMK